MYKAGAVVVWVLAFLVGYGYAIAHYGFLLGVGLGWLPAAILASVVAAIWPLPAFVIVMLILNGITLH